MKFSFLLFYNLWLNDVHKRFNVFGPVVAKLFAPGATFCGSSLAGKGGRTRVFAIALGVVAAFTFAWHAWSALLDHI